MTGARSNRYTKTIQRIMSRIQLAHLRNRLRRARPHTSGIERCCGYTVRIQDGRSYYTQYKDIFVNRIYHFEAQRPDPLILDGGSSIGLSILYFKRIYPQARIIGFEPDPAIFPILTKNVKSNGLQDVVLVNAALGVQPGAAPFSPDGSDGGRVSENDPQATKVQVERLSDYLHEPIDPLKLNIEGQEWPVLQEAAASGGLENVRQLILEYHGWPDGEQHLGDILKLLDRQRFRFLLHDFDDETGRASKPPFRLTPQSTWFCLIYARRQDE